MFQGVARSGAVPVNRIKVAENSSLYTSGDPGQSLYMLERGAVKTVTHSPAGKDCLLDIHVRGEFIGESSLQTSSRGETAIAMVPTTVIQLQYQPFFDYVVAQGWVDSWVQFLLERLNNRQRIITDMVTANCEWRLAATLQRLSRKLATPVGADSRIDLRITHQELSEMVGTTRSRIGLFLKTFRELGLVSVGEDGSLLVNELRLDQFVQSPGEDGQRGLPTTIRATPISAAGSARW
jgi:CRP-like cAMP-binding protein